MSKIFAFLFMIVGLVTCCGQLEHIERSLIVPDKYYAPDLAPYVDEFLLAAEKYTGQMPPSNHLKLVRFASLRYDIAGRCINYVTIAGESYSVVEIDLLYREESAKKGWLRPLVFHELGHCLLGLDHVPQEEGTIMTPAMEYIEDEGEEWESMVRVLFQEGK